MFDVEIKTWKTSEETQNSRDKIDDGNRHTDNPNNGVGRQEF